MTAHTPPCPVPTVCVQRIFCPYELLCSGNLENFCWLVGSTAAGITLHAAESGKEPASASQSPGNTQSAQWNLPPASPVSGRRAGGESWDSCLLVSGVLLLQELVGASQVVWTAQKTAEVTNGRFHPCRLSRRPGAHFYANTTSLQNTLTYCSAPEHICGGLRAANWLMA